MISTTNIRPARRFGPGYFIREQMELRAWNQEDLAEVTEISQKHISDLLNDKKPLTLDMALIFGEVFDTSAQYWLNLDNSYRLWLRDEPSEREIKAEMKAKIYERMPVRDMVKKGWLTKTKTVDELVAATCNYWGTDKLDFTEMDQSELCLTRKSEAFNQFNTYYALTWYKKAQLESEQINIGAYKKEKLEKLVEELYLFTEQIEGIAAFLEELKRIGVKMMLLPHLEKTYLDGAAFFDEANPVVIYTGRYKRIDHFWFTIAHELAHVLHHLSKDIPFVLDNLSDGERNDMETEANRLAAKWLRHDEVMNALTPLPLKLTSERVESIAAELQIHPSIIIGKLAFEQKVSARHLHHYNKQNVIDHIPAQYKRG